MEKQNKLYLETETIKRLMYEQGITENKLAHLIEVAPQTVKRYLSGKSPKMIVLTAAKIARALEVDTSIILKNN